MEIEEAYKIFNDKFIPREHQRRCWELLDNNLISGITLLSGTGSGKTEAILIPSLIKDKKLVLIYPTRSLVNDQILRLKDYIKKLILKNEISKTISIDIGDEEYALQYTKFNEKSINRILNQVKYWYRIQKLKEIKIKVLIDKNETEEKISIDKLQNKLENYIHSLKNFELIYQIGPYTTIEINHLNENVSYVIRKTKKHYFGGDVILTTLDKFLYRFFAYGEQKWNLIYPYRLYMNELTTGRLVICFDEAHLYDSVSYTNFINLLSTLISNNIKVVVMSATLPQEFLNMSETKLGMAVVNGEDSKGNKTYKIIDDENRDEKIIEIINKNIGKKIIIVRNTVRNAYNIYERLIKFSNNNLYNGVPVFFYHGRLFSYIKSQIYEAIKELDEVNKPYILITTHAIEVGCDLNAELLITDYCNPDQLIQRAGRCARKKESKGILFIIGKEFQDEIENYLRDPVAYNYEVYNSILEENNGGNLIEEMIRKETIRPNLKKEDLTDALFHLLYSYVYEFDRTREKLHESGIISTRSWIPSIKLFWVKKESDFGEIRKWSKDNSINDVLLMMREKNLLYNFDPLSISIDMLSTQDSLKVSDLKENYLIFAIQDSESDDGYVKGKINPYLHEIYVIYKSQGYPNINPKDGLIQLPKIFEKKEKGIKIEISVKKQILLPESQYDRKIEYLNIT
ncbi:CRISPR-associated helicase Cas3 [Methanocella conradii HZ254]|uniref:CRISPR-associated helicase Cas3 n=1 Tax=Methanocella conradii (strain DSM 24694 / JCM 17849 / CGMCC 1.5162 / HZ254) TaxID=1041930 RepID=H8I8P2_METCZ|nr:CRISPR-associated helicase Cas3' [Methanocella conradii]AFC99946.1 CRISPR-associated helicase Cas3 [Methanocella conradii HZ254]